MMDATSYREAENMAQTKEEKREANKKAVEKYHSNLMLFKVQPRKEEGQKIKEYAQAAKKSVQGLFLEAVREYMARHPVTRPAPVNPPEEEKEEERHSDLELVNYERVYGGGGGWGK